MERHDAQSDESAPTQNMQVEGYGNPGGEVADKPQRALRSSDQPGRAAWCCMVACILSAPFLFGFDLIVVGDVQPKILQTLGQIDKLPWVSVAYALAAMGTTLLWGRISGVLNVRYTFFVAMAIFEAGSALSGAAPNMNALIIGRALSGVGAVGIYNGAMSIVAMVTSIQQRPLYIGMMSVALCTSNIIAPMVGGAFGDSRATWRWAFYINICISGLFFPGYVYLFPSATVRPLDDRIERWRSLDPVGNVLWLGASTSLLMAISYGGALYPWNSGQVIGLFVCAALSWSLFATQQWLHVLTDSAVRIFPSTFLRSKEMCILFAQISAAGALSMVPVFLLPLYFQFARGSSAIESGLHLLPFVVLRGIVTLLNGVLMRKYGYYMPWYMVGSVLCFVGSAPFLTVTATTPSAYIYGYTVFLGAGVGAFNQASFAVAQARTENRLIPPAIAFIMCGQVVGNSLALAVANSIFINQATNMIAHSSPGVARQVVQQAISDANFNTSGSVTRINPTAAIWAVVAALDQAWATLVAASALSVILAVFMRRDKLFQQAT